MSHLSNFSIQLIFVLIKFIKWNKSKRKQHTPKRFFKKQCRKSNNKRTDNKEICATTLREKKIGSCYTYIQLNVDRGTTNISSSTTNYWPAKHYKILIEHISSDLLLLYTTKLTFIIIITCKFSLTCMYVYNILNHSTDR